MGFLDKYFKRCFNYSIITIAHNICISANDTASVLMVDDLYSDTEVFDALLNQPTFAS